MTKNYWIETIRSYMDDFDLQEYQGDLDSRRYRATGMSLNPRVVGLVQVKEGLVVVVEENPVRTGIKVEDIK